MTKPMDYTSVMGRKQEIMLQSIGLDFSQFESGSIAFDYEAMMKAPNFSMEEMMELQNRTGVGNTPLVELKNLSELARKCAPEGKGARIFVKDEACNASGSYKARRASTCCHKAKELGYKGVISATSGNYGAAVASQAAKLGLKCIIVQECYDSRGVGQPEIVEKARKCEALGAEVVQLTVGPELFYKFLLLLEETGYYNASLYSPFAVAGIETLGYEIAMQFRKQEGRDPDYVVATNAGGGNLTGTARGLKKAGATDTKVVAASVDLTGLHMASDEAFNKKSFTTGHTGFGVPFTTWPDRSDVPRSAARPLRYMDRYVTITQGDVFYITECLANLEGLEKGPAGNTSLAAAFALAQELDQDKIICVQETEYTGAGKHVQPQLDFARDNGVEIYFGEPSEEVPGKNIVIPSHPSKIVATDLDLDKLRTSLIKSALKNYDVDPTEADLQFLAEDTNTNVEFVKAKIAELKK